ncbi:MAG TPA: hypothetical protein PKC72_11515 [Chitinophagaceae bacterium]|nr:hypothetical protein [Chitinophagaceae bacterium]
MKDTKSLLLGLLSAGLVGTWVYHLYDKTQYSKMRNEVFIKDSLAVAQGIQDSLHRIYSAALNDLDAKLDSTRSDADSLKTQLNAKLTEVYRLRNEINGILKNRGASKEDLAVARVKIKELQTLVDDLKTQKLTIEEEKQNLNEKMNRLNGDIAGLQENMNRLTAENKTLNEKLSLASLFVASDLQLTPVAVKNEKEQETVQSKKVSKLVISFTVQNNIAQFDNAEIYIAITQPDGSVLKNDDVWESTTMNLYNGNKVPYTRKVKFEYQKGESKQLLFSINADEYYKGTYTLQVYHNGRLIGQAMKTLS